MEVIVGEGGYVLFFFPYYANCRHFVRQYANAEFNRIRGHEDQQIHGAG